MTGADCAEACALLFWQANLRVDDSPLISYILEPFIRMQARQSRVKE
jgi:hypothetical protein